SELRAATRSAEAVYLAPDPDREGEAIAWHLVEALKIPPDRAKRVTFNEITRRGVLEAFKRPGDISMPRVNAQQARRFLDRIVGYKLSPLLWKKVGRGLSAGRVQSVAVRLIVEREREIKAFTPQEYWTIEGQFNKDKINFAASLSRHQGKNLTKFDIGSSDLTKNIVDELNKKTWRVGSLNRRPTKRSPLPPFTTSTLQQEANRRLGFSVKQTMMLAQ